MAIRQTAGRDALSNFAPAFAAYNDDVLFGQVWNDTQLDVKTRCMITLTALVSKGIVDSSLQYHIRNAKAHGVTRDEMASLLTHVAFYAGWPNAWGAFRMALEVYNDEITPDDHTQYDGIVPPSWAGGLFGVGAPNTAYAQYFTGKSWLKPLTQSSDHMQLANVTFEPGCINHWHKHNATVGGGQVLIGVAGVGRYQIEGEDSKPIHPGDVVVIPPNTKHWHGASEDSWFSHIAIAVPGVDISNEWLEPVVLQ